MWNWHSLTDCTQNNLSRSPAKLCQTTSHTAAVWNQSRCPSDSLQAPAVRGIQFYFIWFRDETCLPSNHHSSRRTIGFMHQLITRSDTSIPADCYACRLWRPLPCHKWVSPWGEGERPVLLQCLAITTDASSNQTCRRTWFIDKTICCLRRNWLFFVFCDFPK